MSIELPSLPYAYDALEPVISSATLKTHHGAHHRAYVDKVNALVRDTPVADSSLETIVQWSARGAANDGAVAIFNNAAQAWNHTFYWRSLRPAGEKGARPRGRLAALIASGFGSYGGFVDAFKSAATSHFGSGCQRQRHGGQNRRQRHATHAVVDEEEHPRRRQRERNRGPRASGRGGSDVSHGRRPHVRLDSADADRRR